MNMTIPVEALMILIRAKEPKTNITANELMMMTMKMIYYKLKLVTCNYLKMDKNTMIIMMKIHCVKWFTDRRNVPL